MKTVRPLDARYLTRPSSCLKPHSTKAPTNRVVQHTILERGCAIQPVWLLVFLISVGLGVLGCNACRAKFQILHTTSITAMGKDSPTFKCSAPGCTIVVASLPELAAHMRGVHKPHPCRHCSMRFAKPDQARAHIKSFHNRRAQPAKVQRSAPAQKSSGEKAAEPPIVRTSNKSHGRRFETFCNFCGLRFISEKTYHHHVAKHGSEYHCSQCGDSFPDSESRLEHIALRKEGHKPFTCTLCTQGFSSQKELSTHTLAHQDVPQPFQCQACCKSFADQSSLRRHLATHLQRGEAFVPVPAGMQVPSVMPMMHPPASATTLQPPGIAALLDSTNFPAMAFGMPQPMFFFPSLG